MLRWGNRRPIVRPRKLEWDPAAQTIASARSSPASVATPVTRPLWVRIELTAQYSRRSAPASRAPLAKPSVAVSGSAWPSLGV
jgi:hypothetical protein